MYVRDIARMPSGTEHRPDGTPVNGPERILVHDSCVSNKTRIIFVVLRQHENHDAFITTQES